MYLKLELLNLTLLQSAVMKLYVHLSGLLVQQAIHILSASTVLFVCFFN